VSRDADNHVPPMTTPTISDLRILHLAEHARDAESLSRAVDEINQAWTVQHVATEADYVAALDAVAPDVIIVSDTLPQFGLMDALREAQRRRPGSPFLITASECDPQALEALKAGAADFVRKSDLERLGPAIVAALEARTPLRKLSNRQLEVLQLLSSGRSTKSIAERLNLSVKTVETHRAQVMKRLGIRELAGLVRYSIYVGLVSAA
jgi:DNA-binding NarL/FixJ family response regulator